MTKADLELERYTKNGFKRHKVFQVASTLRDADFVFFVMLDADSGKIDEVAVVVHHPIIRTPMETLMPCATPRFGSLITTSAMLKLH